MNATRYIVSDERNGVKKFYTGSYALAKWSSEYPDALQFGKREAGRIVRECRKRGTLAQAEAIEVEVQ